MDSRHKDCRKDAFCFDFPSHKGKDDEEVRHTVVIQGMVILQAETRRNARGKRKCNDQSYKYVSTYPGKKKGTDTLHVIV